MLFGGLKFRVAEIFGGIIFLCSHKFILVQNVWWTADYLGSMKFWLRTAWSGVRNTNAQSGGDKLRLHKHFKKSFKFESYLTDKKNHHHRKAFCQFRISAHSLMCEIGGYCNIPYEQWLCRLCEMNKVELEHHFIFECNYYSDLKNQLPNQLAKDRDRHPVRRHMHSLLSSSDPAVQT